MGDSHVILVRLQKFVTISTICLLLLLCVAFVVSHYWCISYARGNFFFVMTDGYFVIPWSNSQPRTWDDWGWWVQQPWQEGPFLTDLFQIRQTRQIGGQGLHIWFVLPILPLLFVVTIRKIENASGSQLAMVLYLSWASYLLGLALHNLASRNQGQLFCLIGYLGATVAVPSSLVGIKKFIRSRKTKKKICKICSYNLFGNTTGRCPECGTQISEIEMKNQPPVPTVDLDATYRSR